MERNYQISHLYIYNYIYSYYILYILRKVAVQELIFDLWRGPLSTVAQLNENSWTCLNKMCRSRSVLLWILIWVKVFKNGPNKICGRQPLQNFTWSIPEYYEPYIVLKINQNHHSLHYLSVLGHQIYYDLLLYFWFVRSQWSYWMSKEPLNKKLTNSFRTMLSSNIIMNLHLLNVVAKKCFCFYLFELEHRTKVILKELF